MLNLSVIMYRDAAHQSSNFRAHLNHFFQPILKIH
jgi:hypothetical protein